MWSFPYWGGFLLGFFWCVQGSAVTWPLCLCNVKRPTPDTNSICRWPAATLTFSALVYSQFSRLIHHECSSNTGRLHNEEGQRDKGRALIGSQQRCKDDPLTVSGLPCNLCDFAFLTCCCCVPHMQRAAHSSAGSLHIVYSPLFVVMVRWGISYKWTGIWQGLYDVGWGGVGAVFWESPISSGGRAFWSVGPRCVSAQSPAPSSVSLCFPTAPARLHAWQTDRCYLPCISSSGPLSLSTNSPLLAHRLQIPSASLRLDKGQYQWQNIFYVWNVAHNKQSSIRFV